MNSLDKQRAELVNRLNQSKSGGTLMRDTVKVVKQPSKEDVRKLAAMRLAHEQKSQFEPAFESMSFQKTAAS